FLNAPPTTAIYTLSLHDALPIWGKDFNGDGCAGSSVLAMGKVTSPVTRYLSVPRWPTTVVATPALVLRMKKLSSPSSPLTSRASDRKSTRLNSSHVEISYAVFCL